MTAIALTDLRDPRVQGFSDLPGQSTDPKHFVVETQIAIERLLASDLGCKAVVCTPGRADALVRAAEGSTPVYVLPRSELNALVGFDMHRGCAALGVRPQTSWVHFVARAASMRRVVITERVADPRNLGAIIRTARSLGVEAVLAASCGADPYSRRAIRASMGSVFQLICFQIPSAAAAAHDLNAAGFTTVAAATDGAAVPMAQLASAPRLALAVGNEGEGISRELRQACGHTATISMASGVDSLSVTAATAIMLHALCPFDAAAPVG